MKILKKLLRIVHTKISLSIRRTLRRAKPSSQIKLNLGCGSDVKFGYVNVDQNPKYKPDLTGEVIPVLYSFDDETVTEILSFHLINYFSHSSLIDFLEQCFRVLKKEGELIIEGPDFQKFLVTINKTEFGPQQLYPLFATSFVGPTHEKPYINAVPFDWLREMVSEIGFNSVKIDDPLTHGGQVDRDSRLVAKK